VRSHRRHVKPITSDLRCHAFIAASCASIVRPFSFVLVSGDYLILGVKGQDSEQDQVKRRLLDEWYMLLTLRATLAAGTGRFQRILLTVRDLLGR
jgi:hypothetical protein